MHSFNYDHNYNRKLIVEHYTNPQCKGFVNVANALTYHQASVSCVDDFHVQLVITAQKISTARFTGIGCAISTSALDLFCLLIEGKTISEIKKIISNYEAMLAEKPFTQTIIGDMIAFKNVPRQPNRIKCALLGINGFEKLL